LFFKNIIKVNVSWIIFSLFAFLAGLTEKDWPKEYFKSLISFLSKHQNYKIILQGNKRQRRFIKKIMLKKSESVFNIAGKYSLHESSSLLSKLTYLLAMIWIFTYGSSIRINMIGLVDCGSYGIFFPYP